MNIHPIFVRFPIALLVLYSILEICAYLSPALRRQSWVAGARGFLLVTGALSTFVALATGGMAEDLVRDVNPNGYIIETHSTFAGAATITYLVLLAAYSVRLFDVKGWGDRIAGTNKLMVSIWNFKKRFWYSILDSWLLPALALLWLILLTVTGALGAAIVYGPNIDPAVSFIYHLFWVQ